MVVNYQIESTPLSSIIANLNPFATLPTTSTGAGEIIHYTGDNTIRWNSQTVDPTTDPTWSDLGAGVTDHGALTGLSDDDHTLYLLINGSRAMNNDLDIGNNYINNCNIINMDAGFHPAAYIKPVFTDPTYDLKIWGESEIMFFNGSLESESESVSITTEHLNLHTNKIVSVGTPTADSDAATKGYTDALPGVDGVSFIIDQDNAGAGVSSSLRFNRGSTDGDAAIWWDETDDEFQFESDVGVTIANIKVANIGATKIKAPSATDLTFEVNTGQAFVFSKV